MSDHEARIILKVDGVETLAKLRDAVKAANKELANVATNSPRFKELQGYIENTKFRIKELGTATQIETNRMMGSYFKLGESIRSVQSTMMGLFAVVAGAHVFIKMAEQGAQAEQNMIALDRVMKQLGGDTVKEMELMKEASAGLIDESDIAKLTVRALRLGIPLKELPKLMEIARMKFRDFGREGETVATMFDKITTAIGGGRAVQLVKLGLIDKIDDSMKNLKSDVEDTEGAVSGLAVKGELLNRVLENGEKQLKGFNSEQLTSLERIMAIKVKIQDTTEALGGGAVRLGAYLMGVSGTVLSYLDLWIARIMTGMAFMERVANNVQRMLGLGKGDNTFFKDAQATSVKNLEEARKLTAEYFKLASMSSKDVMASFNTGDVGGLNLAGGGGSGDEEKKKKHDEAVKRGIAMEKMKQKAIADMNKEETDAYKAELKKRGDADKDRMNELKQQLQEQARMYGTFTDAVGATYQNVLGTEFEKIMGNQNSILEKFLGQMGNNLIAWSAEQLSNIIMNAILAHTTQAAEIAALSAEMVALASASAPAALAVNIASFGVAGDLAALSFASASTAELLAMSAVSIPKFHQGGVVQGGSDVPVVAQGGEMFLTKQQQTALFNMISTSSMTSGKYSGTSGRMRPAIVNVNMGNKTVERIVIDAFGNATRMRTA